MRPPDSAIQNGERPNGLSTCFQRQNSAVRGIAPSPRDAFKSSTTWGTSASIPSRVARVESANAEHLAVHAFDLPHHTLGAERFRDAPARRGASRASLFGTGFDEPLHRCRE